MWRALALDMGGTGVATPTPNRRLRSPGGYIEGPGDRFTDTVYIDEAWIAEETKVYDHMVAAGGLDPDTEVPRFEAIAPTVVTTCCLAQPSAVGGGGRLGRAH